MSQKHWIISHKDNYGEIQKQIADGDRVTLINEDGSKYEWTWLSCLDAWQFVEDLKKINEKNSIKKDSDELE
jgi:hypothetical protein